LKRLGAIDAVRAPAPRTDSQIFLSRIDKKLSILVEILAERASNRKNYIHHAVVTDISEYGLAFAHSMDIEKGTTLEISLQLPMGDSIRTMDIAGTVVHVKKTPEEGSLLANIYGVEFFDIKGQDQNDILHWIFALQREQIRRRREKETA